ncbi:phosphatidylinositol phospholipase C [Eremomyces bilateralis CBS 781.70]|uniref:Phosphatidylinositol phospholipase C n=1 Tax=Eremomyces bilateralis CBS 781.70 TaxID=1392243 RepID=A0A6G1GI25_9PEZI|nr:phosphatidylinositol phospholipase C [Eremomyces bilateralis CBS 781.70]KAF1817520.1 phosphatidylinositol phospholipase C [Eremomyces bilateralis CBS 781.70]
MAPHITIRNLTSDSITVVLLERFSPPGHDDPGHVKKLSSLTRNVTEFVSNATGLSSLGPPSRKLPDNAQPYARQDVDLPLDSFAARSTDLAPTDRSADDIARLTVSVDNQRYRIDVPGPQPKYGSQTFTPLDQSPRRELTGIWLSGSSTLAVYSSAHLDSWMRELPDHLPLSALSIPGTHNSPTCHSALPSVRCQAVSPREQLLNGVRFFDVRVQPEEPENPNHDGLVLVHGVFPISLTGKKHFRDLMNESLEFLDQHPSETLIMSIKREGPGTHNDAQLAEKLARHYAGDEGKWFTQPRVPTLGEARGKIVLFRRFGLSDELRQRNDGRGWGGLNAENWAYNTQDCETGDVRVQDFCEVLDTVNIDDKIKYVTEHLARAGGVTWPTEGDTGKVFVNFLTASNFWSPGCWPDKIAAKLNPAAIDFLAGKQQHGDQGDWGTGIVVMDWVGDEGDWDLVRAVVGMNARIMKRTRR